MIHKIERIAIRTGRIAIGAAFAILALLLVGNGWENLSTPFAQASVVSILKGLGLLCLAYLAGGAGWVFAFGEGPEPKK